MPLWTETSTLDSSLKGRAGLLTVEELLEGLRDPRFNVRFESIISIARMEPDLRLVEGLSPDRPDRKDCPPPSSGCSASKASTGAARSALPAPHQFPWNRGLAASGGVPTTGAA